MKGRKRSEETKQKIRNTVNKTPVIAHEYFISSFFMIMAPIAAKAHIEHIDVTMTAEELVKKPNIAIAIATPRPTF